MSTMVPPFSSSSAPTPPDPALLRKLRARIRRLEGHAPQGDGTPGVVALGAADIDGALPWGGLPRAALHEVLGTDTGTAAAGFCAALAARLAGATGSVLWCRRGHDLHGPGLALFGLDLGRLIVVRGRGGRDVLWAMEEGLRSGALAAVLGEIRELAPTARRRLQLAAETGGVTALLLRPGDGKTPPGAALTRWRIAAAPGTAAGPRWRVELERCRGAMPAAWLVEWRNEETGGFTVVAELRHGPVDRAAGPAAAGEGRLAG
jgi:protein ImuA